MFLIFLLLLIIISFIFIIRRQSHQEMLPLTVNLIPTLKPEQGQGINMNSKQIQQATFEIKKITPDIPYEKNITLSTGLSVSILIPPKELLDNPWTLSVQIFNIDYQVPPQDKEYEKMKKSFREAAYIVLDWIRSKGCDPNKMVISWGDKAYIQRTAEEWLKSP